MHACCQCGETHCRWHSEHIQPASGVYSFGSNPYCGHGCCCMLPLPPAPYPLPPFSPSLISLTVSVDVMVSVGVKHHIYLLTYSFGSNPYCGHGCCCLLHLTPSSPPFFPSLNTQCSDRYILSLFPHLHTPFPLFSLPNKTYGFYGR